MRYFTADTHLTKVPTKCMSLIKGCHREFTDSVEMSMNFIEQINRTVGRRDTLFIVGDFANDKVGFFRPLIECQDVWLITGNHDQQVKSARVFGGHFRSDFMTKIRDVKVWLKHYPAAFWPCSHHGAMHLYGHMHRQREDFLNALMPDRRAMDVGIDNARWLLGEYRPFSEDEVFDLIGNRPGHDHVDYYKHWQAQPENYRA